jgi:hypothetical protein
VRRALLIGLVIALAGLGYYYYWRTSNSTHGPRAESRAGSSAVITSAGSATPTVAVSKHVRRLPPEERRRLGDELSAALARQRAASTPTGSSNTASATSVPIVALEDAGPDLQQALQESIELLAECYKQRPGAPRNATARMVMTSDAELGTVIDTDRLTDADGAPLETALETCLRDTIDSLALPPLGKPGKLQLQYTFKFD